MGGYDEPVKARLRRELLAQRRAMDPGALVVLSRRACERLAEWPAFGLARRLVLYAAHDGELDPAPLAAAARRRGIAVYYPRVAGASLGFHQATTDDLVAGSHGILEPPPSSSVLPADAGGVLVVVPGIAFTRRGERLGSGRGHYDRALASLPDTVRVGLVAERFVLAALPQDRWDVRMDGIATEAGVSMVARAAATRALSSGD